MKAVKLYQNIGLVIAGSLIFSIGAAAQEDLKAPKKREPITSVKTEQPVAVAETTAATATLKADTQTAPDAKKDDKSLRRGTMSEEESAIIPYYNNYLDEYRLGPQDVISVEVFGQCPDYCKAGITVPPTARISYPLIKNGIKVAGKTVDQVQEEIKKQLEEYIIDPQVTVTLEKVGSARFSVLGDVATPGVKMMERRLSVYEAIVESGGILRTGDGKRVVVIRQTANGLTSISVNLTEIARGKAEMIYLVPGDQVIVPGNTIKKVETVAGIIGKFSIFRMLFGGGF